jgi:DNA primase small subunit
MNLGSSTFVQNVFRGYYAEDCNTQNFVMATEKREFGFVLFKGGMLRHKNFKDQRELALFLKSYVPSDAYYSCAYYEDPEAEMDTKGWLGADLIFDIDADHIPTSCSKVHDEWTCAKCGFAGKGVVPEKCPICNSERFDETTWACEVCLASAKAETIKLLDMLIQDFGFSKDEIRVSFSGHRGYHVHVENEAVKTLDAVSRKEIVDYVYGLGLDTGFASSNEKAPSKAGFPTSPRLNDSGWRKRLARGMYDFILHAQKEDYGNIGLDKKTIETLMKNKNGILRSWDDVGPYRAVRNVGFETWRRIVTSCVESLTAHVDTVVTTDIHRLIRLAGTLHGKTGLKKVDFPIPELESFDPFKSAVAFKKGTVTVFVSSAPEFRLGDETFGPYEKCKVELPTAAAILLIRRDRAEVVEKNV